MAIRNYRPSDEEISKARIEALKKNIMEIIGILEALLAKGKIIKEVCARKKNDLENCLFLLNSIRPNQKNRKDTAVKLLELSDLVHRVRIFCSKKQEE